MDQIKKYLACQGRVSVTCVEITDVVKEARKIHKLSELATETFGKVLTAGIIIGTTLKEKEDSVTIQIKGNGPIGNIVCVADGNFTIKGYVLNPEVRLPLNENGKQDISGAIGNDGNLYIIKDLGLKEPYIGITNITEEEISEIFMKYFSESEQTKSIIKLGLNTKDDEIKRACGYFITFMPDATEEDKKQIEKAIKKAEPIDEMLEKQYSLQQIAEKITGDENLMVLLGEIVPKYECNCNKEKFKEAIKSLSKEEIDEIFDELDKVETVCQFCNKKYEYTKKEIEED